MSEGRMGGAMGGPGRGGLTPGGPGGPGSFTPTFKEGQGGKIRWMVLLKYFAGGSLGKESCQGLADFLQHSCYQLAC